jgi:DNA-binding CsgD family transcriptional regulator
VWWRAEIADAPDSGLADELDAVGSRSLDLGDDARALSALRRSVTLTDDPLLRAERLMRAAEAAARTGANQTSADLLTRAEADSDHPLLRARCAWHREILPVEQSALAHGDFRPALTALDALREAGDEDAAIAGLLHLAAVAWSHTVDDSPGRALIAAAQTFGLDESDPRMLLLTAVTEPIASADRVVELVRRRGPGDNDDPRTAWLLGYALNLAGQIDTSAVRLRRAVEGLREQSDLVVLPQALMALAWECFLGGEYAEGRAHIGECIALALDVDDAGLAAAAGVALSLYDAVEGTSPDPAAIAGDSPLAARALESEVMRSTLIAAEGIAALARGDARTAAASLGPLADPESPHHHLQFSVVTLPDLVDAALATGSRAIAEASVIRLERVHAGWHSPTLESALGYARIALADDDALEDAGERLQREPLPMPLHQARAQLLIGSRLRRARRIERSRLFLARALDGFGELGCERWAARCRDELRATGERLADEPRSGRHVLTPQELLVAGYAATGLTNREIAERLFLSPRTVATHLHATYRKLGITERGQLTETLGEAQAPPRLVGRLP